MQVTLILGNPTNVVLCEGFKVNYLAFSAYTVFPFLACSLAGLIALYLQFTKNHIPKKVTAPQVDPKSVLLDPVGAIAGGIALLTTLVLITGTGFVGVQAWMISMPAAVSKAMFDLTWDLFRDKPIGGNDRASRSGEEEIEMHHVNSGELSEARRSRSFDPRQLTHRPKRQPVEADPAPTDSEDAAPTGLYQSPTQPEVISLPNYLKEKLDDSKLRVLLKAFVDKFPTFSATLRRLPYALLPFAFSQFILVEALSYTGWIDVFSRWLAVVVGFSLPATVFVVGVVSVVLCNVSGTNIGATILLVKILQHPNFADREGMPPKLLTGGMLALAVGSNIGAVSLTFSASLAGSPQLFFKLTNRSPMARNFATKGNHGHCNGVCKVEYPPITIYDGNRMHRCPCSRNNCPNLIQTPIHLLRTQLFKRNRLDKIRKGDVPSRFN